MGKRAARRGHTPRLGLLDPIVWSVAAGGAVAVTLVVTNSTPSNTIIWSLMVAAVTAIGSIASQLMHLTDQSNSRMDGPADAAGPAPEPDHSHRSGNPDIQNETR